MSNEATRSGIEVVVFVAALPSADARSEKICPHQYQKRFHM